MARLHRLVPIAGLLLAITAGPIRAGDGGDEVAGETKTEASLADRLTTGLRVRRPEDVEFVERLAEQVRRGRLPAKLVDSTYLWAIRRRQTYPFPAFQRAITIQADRLGIELD